MFDCGYHQFKAWARGDAHSIRWYGAFDPDRTAREQWVINDSASKVRDEAFEPFERGWKAAQAEQRAAIGKAAGDGGPT